MELAEIIKSAVPQKARREKNPCKKTFQAIRIEVNRELEHLNIALDKAFDCLNVGGQALHNHFPLAGGQIGKAEISELLQGLYMPA